MDHDNNYQIVKNIFNSDKDSEIGFLTIMCNNLITELKFKNGVEDLIHKRLEKGKKEYGHGIRVNDDTRSWGTVNNSWKEMALEELLDAIIYFSSEEIRKDDKEKS